MAAKKKRPKAPQSTATFTTRLPAGLHQRLKVAAAHHGVKVQDLVSRGILMVLGDL